MLIFLKRWNDLLSRKISYEFAEKTILNNQITELPLDYQPLFDKISENKRKVLKFSLNLFINILKFSPTTTNSSINYIFNENESNIENDYDYIANELAVAENIIEIGCGWGNFLNFLLNNHDFKAVFAVDYVTEHVVSTKFLNRLITVIQSDARKMDLVPSNTFDFAIMRGVVEHIGDHNLPTGQSGPNLMHQYSAIKEVARILKPGGKIFICTGNYLFPRDDEVHEWLYHWLPENEKKIYNEKKGISPDKYWLLSWDELNFILHSSGFIIERVNCDIPNNLLSYQMIENLDKAMIGLDSDMKLLWKTLIESNPKYYPNWRIIAKKANAEEFITPMDRLCYLARINGNQCEFLEKILGLNNQLATIQRGDNGIIAKIFYNFIKVQIILARKIIHFLNNKNNKYRI